MEFRPFPKIARLSRDMVITEKIDGTNASVWIEELEPNTYEDETVTAYVTVDMAQSYPGQPHYALRAASRKRFITPEKDNFGFAAWTLKNAAELIKLGPGIHFGEWWGLGIQRNYGLDEKRFSLFNTGRWLDTHIDPVDVYDGDKQEDAPSCCHVVPVLWRGPFGTRIAEGELEVLRQIGSSAAPGYMNPEGIVIFHTAAQTYFKKTFEGDKKYMGK